MPPSADERDRNAWGRPEQARPRDRTGRPLPYDTDRTDLTQDWAYDTVEGAIEIAVQLWDDHRFFEAHECLEDVWHHAPDEDRDFWQGVIQVAVGCVHHQRGNATGAAVTFDKAASRLVRYPDVHHGIDVEQLLVFCDGAAAAIREAGFCVEIGYPDLPTMDDGPWFRRDGGPTRLTREPPWKQEAWGRSGR